MSNHEPRPEPGTAQPIPGPGAVRPTPGPRASRTTQEPSAAQQGAEPDDVAARTARAESLPLEERADAFAALHDELRTRLESGQQVPRA
ncbi:hypothetical protein [Curtobacterium sp. BH-2-1-1]|uniref:hypothetical protein n=1 Tax=Curtobacterium sp. BH-2-1-1 TaxID=1905847 RepID=UPI0011A78DFE|nr:hypothetical protein [Curtobacterium sp. BH-2-1-1]